MTAGVDPMELADRNLIESIREHGRWQTSHTLDETGGVLLLAGSSSYPGAYRNCAARLDPRVPAGEVLQRAQDFFGPRRRAFTLWARTGRDDDLEALMEELELARVANGPCMYVDAPLAPVALPDGVRLEHCATVDAARDAITVNADAYTMVGLPEYETHATFPEPARLLSDRLRVLVAYRDDQPLASAMTIFSGEGAGLYWVGTTRRAQRTGLGALCTQVATNQGFEHGARIVMLQASPFGIPVYERLGYRTYGHARWYRHPVP